LGKVGNDRKPYVISELKYAPGVNESYSENKENKKNKQAKIIMTHQVKNAHCTEAQ